MPRRPNFSKMDCSVAHALDVVGEDWTLLILRESLMGSRRFYDFQKNLGIATNVLTSRLKRLTKAGLLEERAYQEHPPRYEYVPTEKTRDLGPILVGLIVWGNKHFPGKKGPPLAVVHETCGHATTPRLLCSHCNEPIAKGTVRIVSTRDASLKVAG
jgi:DNA-binding HxlR family transcriptional regulator